MATALPHRRRVKAARSETLPAPGKTTTKAPKPPTPNPLPGREWWAPTALTVPLEAHLLAERGLPGYRAALCGRIHRTWRPRHEFAAPDQIPYCQACHTAARTGHTAAPRPISNGHGLRAQPSEPVDATPQQRRAAVLTIAAHALNADDLRQLCAALGLDPHEARRDDH